MKKYFFIKLLVVCIFMVVAFMICDSTKYYFAPINYRDDEIRVIIDDSEKTRDMPDVALFIEDKIMLSFDTIQKYFDKYIYFDEKYETIIVTSDEDVLKMKIDEEILTLNGERKNIAVPVQNISGDIYIPIEELQEIYDIDVTHNEKIIITTADSEYKQISMDKKQNVKLHKRELSLTTGKIKKGEVLYVFSGDENSDYLRVRTPNGDLGYIRKDKVNGDVLYENMLQNETKQAKKKINLTWEYAGYSTPNRVGQEKIEGLDVISPTWIYLKNTSGDVRTNTISQTYINWAKSKGYQLWPILKNDGMQLEKTSAVITDMYAREALINNVVEVALKYDFDGINLDFENMYKSDSGDYSEFVREFSATLRRNGLVSSVDVNVPDGSDTWSLCYDQKPISDACDYMVLMAYDQYGIGADGPVAGLYWVEQHIQTLLERGVDNSKFILGVPFYSKYRKNRILDNGEEKNIYSDPLYMESAKNYLNNSKYKNAATWIDRLGQYYIEYRSGNIVERIWIEDENALEKKVELVNKYDLAGVASWRWGYETKEAWEVINSTLNKR